MFDVLPVTSPLKMDCGPTSLKMLLAYYGVEADLNDLIRECKTRLIGCTGKDILRVGREHGLTDMVAFKMDAEELIKQDRPGIIWWKYQHWCVFCGCDENGNVMICNPDRGRYRMTFGTFKSMYTEIALFNGEPHSIPTKD